MTHPPDWMFDAITVREGFAAMFKFLEAHYGRTKSDDVACLLGSLTLLPDGSTLDPAAKDDWLRAVDEARRASRVKDR